MLWQNLDSFLLNVLQLLLPASFLYLLVLLIRVFERLQFANLMDAPPTPPPCLLFSSLLLRLDVACSRRKTCFLMQCFGCVSDFLKSFNIFAQPTHGLSAQSWRSHIQSMVIPMITVGLARLGGDLACLCMSSSDGGMLAPHRRHVDLVHTFVSPKKAAKPSHPTRNDDGSRRSPSSSAFETHPLSYSHRSSSTGAHSTKLCCEDHNNKPRAMEIARISTHTRRKQIASAPPMEWTPPWDLGCVPGQAWACRL